MYKKKDYESLLDESLNCICVCSVESFDVLYLNKQALELTKTSDIKDVIGKKKCYEVFMHRDKPCEYCSMKNLSENETVENVIPFPSDRFFREKCKLIKWDGVAAKVGYLTEITEERKIQKELSRSYNLIEEAMDNSSLYFWEYNIKTGSAYQGNKCVEDFDLPRNVDNFIETIIKKEIINETSINDFIKMHQALENGEKSVEKDILVGSNNEEEFWCRVKYTAILDDDGNMDKAMGIAENINEYKKAMHHYEEEKDYRKSLRNGLVASHRVNLTKGIVEESFSEIHKHKLKENDPLNNMIFRQICEECIPNKRERDEYYNTLNPEKMLTDYKNGIANHETIYRAKMANGQLKWVKVIVKLIKKPGATDVIAFFNTWDVDSENLAKAMINTVVDMDYDYIALLDGKHGNYTIFARREHGTVQPPFYTSDYENEVREYAEKHLVCEDIAKNIKDMSYDNVIKQLKVQSVFTCYCRIKEEDGRVSHKKLRFSYLSKEEKKILLTRTDVTDVYTKEQKKNQALETALVAAEQANAAKSDFLARMSHEIRTPMNAIIGMSAIAAQSIDDSEQVSDCISKIGISSRFLLSLINDILDMSRIESGKTLLKAEKIPFEEFIIGINSICYGQANNKNIEYECVVDKNIDDYYIGDAMKVQQILINIISNAIKFTPQGGKVSLLIEQRNRTKDYASIRFTINDTGCGISDEFMPKIFEPFTQEYNGTTTMYGGTGLGLSICKHLVELMDGKINIRSIVGVGSEFNVELKLGISDESKKRRDRKLSIDFSTLKALIVDDDVVVCQHTKMIMEEIGVESEWSDSGSKAVEKVRKQWDAGKYYDLILIDWKMPEMDGIETTRRIRKIVGPDVTIIIMTAYDWAAIEHEAKIAGVNLLMNKPMFKSTLISAFEKAFGNKEEEKKCEKEVNFDFTGKRLLLVEDHPLNVEVATKLLESKGFAVDHAENGVRAVEVFTMADDGYYDGILMDIRMPIMDGLQATQVIRHLTKKDAKSVPIIAMTANAFDDDMEKSKAAGMNAHLAKPIEPLQLYTTLYNFLKSE